MQVDYTCLDYKNRKGEYFERFLIGKTPKLSPHVCVLCNDTGSVLQLENLNYCLSNYLSSLNLYISSCSKNKPNYNQILASLDLAGHHNSRCKVGYL